jgi:hypothetical protein
VEAAATAAVESATAAVEAAAATMSAATMSAAKSEGGGRCRKCNCQTGSSDRWKGFHDCLFLSLSCELSETTVADINGSKLPYQLTVMPLDRASPEKSGRPILRGVASRIMEASWLIAPRGSLEAKPAGHEPGGLENVRWVGLEPRSCLKSKTGASGTGPGLKPVGQASIANVLFANLHAAKTPTVGRHDALANQITAPDTVVIVAAAEREAVIAEAIPEAIATVGVPIPAVISAAIAEAAETTAAEAAMKTTPVETTAETATAEASAMKAAAVKAAASTMKSSAAETTSMTASAMAAASERGGAGCRAEAHHGDGHQSQNRFTQHVLSLSFYSPLNR